MQTPFEDLPTINILKIHHIEKALYDSSTAFYTLHPEIMQEMYDEVISELSKKQGEVSSK